MRGGNYLPEGYFSVSQVAKLTGFSETKLRRLDNSGALPAKRMSRGERSYRVYTQKDIDFLKGLSDQMAREKHFESSSPPFAIVTEDENGRLKNFETLTNYKTKRKISRYIFLLADEMRKYAGWGGLRTTKMGEYNNPKINVDHENRAVTIKFEFEKKSQKERLQEIKKTISVCEKRFSKPDEEMKAASEKEGITIEEARQTLITLLKKQEETILKEED